MSSSTLYQHMFRLSFALAVAFGAANCGLEGLSSDLYTEENPEQTASGAHLTCQPGQVRCRGEREFTVCPESGDESAVELIESCSEGTFCVTGATSLERPCIQYRNQCRDGEPISVDREQLSFRDIATLKPTQRTVQVTNCGPGYLRIDDVDAFSSPTFSLEELPLPIILDAGEVLPVQVLYRPTYENEQEEGELRIEASVLDEPDAVVGTQLGELKIPLRGRAGRQPGQVPIQSRALDFGSKIVHQQVAINTIELIHSDIADYTVQTIEEIEREGDALTLDWGGAPFELIRREPRTLTARFAPTEEGSYLATYRLVITPWPPEAAFPTITLTGTGITQDAHCNPALEPHLTVHGIDEPTNNSDRRLLVAPMSRLHLQAHHLPNAIQRMVLIESPRGSRATIAHPEEGNSAVGELQVDLIGRYAVRLLAEDALGQPGCSVHDVTIDVRSDTEVHLEMFWETPGGLDSTNHGEEVGSNLDLHVVREKRLNDRPPQDWSIDPANCSVFNPNPDWGEPRVTEDDCRVLRAARDHGGPEIIVLGGTDDRYYDIKITNADERGFGPSFATLYVYIRGERRISMGSPGLEAGATWEALRLHPYLDELQIIDKLVE